VLTRISAPKIYEIVGGCRHLHKDELHSLSSCPNVIRMINCKRVRWTGHVAQKRKKRNVYRILVRKLERKRPLGKTRRGEKMMLQSFQGSRIAGCSLHFFGLGLGSMACCCGHGNEPSGSV
jgi:hypothetical protein